MPRRRKLSIYLFICTFFFCSFAFQGTRRTFVLNPTVRFRATKRSNRVHAVDSDTVGTEEDATGLSFSVQPRSCLLPSAFGCDPSVPEWIEGTPFVGFCLLASRPLFGMKRRGNGFQDESDSDKAGGRKWVRESHVPEVDSPGGHPERLPRQAPQSHQCKEAQRQARNPWQEEGNAMPKKHPGHLLWSQTQKGRKDAGRGRRSRPASTLSGAAQRARSRPGGKEPLLYRQCRQVFSSLLAR